MPLLIAFFIPSRLDLAYETFGTAILMKKNDEFTGKEGVETEY